MVARIAQLLLQLGLADWALNEIRAPASGVVLPNLHLIDAIKVSAHTVLGVVSEGADKDVAVAIEKRT